jgi:hypothetical protein
VSGRRRATTSLALASEYEILERLHRSNVFDVYDAWSVERESRCIVKTLRPDRLRDSGARRRHPDLEMCADHRPRRPWHDGVRGPRAERDRVSPRDAPSLGAHGSGSHAASTM